MQEIKELVNRYIQAIHTQDKDEFLSLWTGNEADTLISITKIYKGDQALYDDFLIGTMQKKYSRIDLINDGLTIELLDDKTAIVVFSYHTECILREDGTPFGIQGLETQVLRKIGSQWKIQHIHYSK